MTVHLEPDIHMWLAIGLLALAIVAFAWERVSMEVTAITILVVLLLTYQIFPVVGPDGQNTLSPTRLLEGFANPSLLAVMALLVMGQAMVQTGALIGLTRVFLRLSRRHRGLSVASGFAGVLLTSAFLNNTPVVVMFIPIMQALAARLNWSPSRLMMPLSFAAILGGMTTMIGSSTNLLVLSALTNLGEPPLFLFDITILGACLAAVGALYVGLVLPRLLPHRGGLAGSLLSEGKQFIAEIDVTAQSPLVGQASAAGQFKALPDVTVRLIQRGGQNILPPFENETLKAGDILIVAATRQALTDALARNAGYLLTQSSRSPLNADGQARRPDERLLTEVMIAPASRMIDQTIDMVGFQRRFGCLVLGIQRRGRMARQRLSEIRLAPGDVLLIVGSQHHVDGLSANSDLLLMTWATKEVPRVQRAPHATFIFACAVALAASQALPISVAAIAGASAMILTGCLNVRQAGRALDRTVFMLVGSALALGAMVTDTGAAHFIAVSMVERLSGPSPGINMIVLFLIVAMATNLLSNNACAVLFTPIAVSMAHDLGIPSAVMAITVILAANCSFATPIGYQTNLLVMGPGHYRFIDFVKGGAPLILLMWLTFALVGPMYFGFTPFGQ